MSGAPSLFLLFAVCALLPPDLPADGFLSPPGLHPSHLALAALLVPCWHPAPNIQQSMVARGWKQKPAPCPMAGKSWAAGMMAPALAPLGGHSGWL